MTASVRTWMQSQCLQGLKGQSIKNFLEVIPGVVFVDYNKQHEEPSKGWSVARKRKPVCELRENKI